MTTKQVDNKIVGTEKKFQDKKNIMGMKSAFRLLESENDKDVKELVVSSLDFNKLTDFKPSVRNRQLVYKLMSDGISDKKFIGRAGIDNAKKTYKNATSYLNANALNISDGDEAIPVSFLNLSKGDKRMQKNS